MTDKKQQTNNFDLSKKYWKEALEEILEYFDYKDAYTGLPLDNMVIDQILQIEEDDDLVKENILPCNKNTSDDRNGSHMVYWYRGKDFYSKDRLDKIFEWMGDYRKFLFIPLEQREHVEVEGDSSIYHFTITLPNYFKQKLYYANNGDLQKRISLLEKIVLNNWNDYINKGWLFNGSLNKNRNTPEDKIKNLLDRSADFLLIKDKGKSRESNIISKNFQDKINQSEVPLSATASNIQEYFYSGNDDDEYTMNDSFREIEFKGKTKRVKWKDSKTAKMNSIYRDGVIDESKPYVSEWCTIDTDDIFEFNNKKYKIRGLENYEERKNKPRFDDYKSDYPMDKILAYEQNGELYFFDQNIIQIPREYIITSNT